MTRQVGHHSSTIVLRTPTRVLRKYCFAMAKRSHQIELMTGSPWFSFHNMSVSCPMWALALSLRACLKKKWCHCLRPATQFRRILQVAGHICSLTGKGDWFSVCCAACCLRLHGPMDPGDRRDTGPLDLGGWCSSDLIVGSCHGTALGRQWYVCVRVCVVLCVPSLVLLEGSSVESHVD